MGSPWEAESAGGPGLNDAVLNALFSDFPFGLLILDTELRLVRWRVPAQAGTHFSIGDMAGRNLSDALRRFDIKESEAAERTARRVLETGEPVRDVEVRDHAPLDPGLEKVVSISWLRLQEEAGRVLGLAAVVIDRTDRYRARGRLRLLDIASARMEGTRGVLTLGHELAEALVPDFADAVTVDIIDSVLRGDAPPSPALPSRTSRCGEWAIAKAPAVPGQAGQRWGR